MATKKKSRKAKKSKRTSRKKVTGSKRPAKKQAPKKRPAKKPAPKKKAASTSKKALAKPARQKAARSSTRESAAFELETGSRSAGQSGDLQGLPDVESADSESVDELLEEGNAFEAEAVAGVQRADDNEGQEVHTHEVPEDDVPEEYLDQD
ncbi:MAG: hypothetical protein WAN03_17055 [Candidatus Sulfotelmatobacter sp.]